MPSVLELSFMQNALLAALLASVACGIIGTLVVVNRQVFLAGGVAHTAYGGVGFALFTGLPLLPCASLFTVLCSLLMAYASFNRRERADAFIGVMWAAGMAFGILLIDLTPGYNVDLMSYLFGSILTVPRTDIWIMLGLDIGILLLSCLFYRDFLSLSFDCEFANASGVPVRFLYYLLQIMTAITVVMTIQIAGLILVIALLTIPAMTAELWSKSLGDMMWKAVCISIFFCLGGLTFSYQFDFTSGASIIAVASCGYLIALGLRKIL